MTRENTQASDAAAVAAASASLQAKLKIQEGTITDLKLRIMDFEMLLKNRNSQIDELGKNTSFYQIAFQTNYILLQKTN